jgi:hypothetical protein
MGGDGAIVDDPSAARFLRLHDAEGRLEAEEGAGQVDVDDLPESIERHVLDAEASAIDAGIVEEKIDSAEMRDRLCEQSLDGSFVGDVGWHAERRLGGIGAEGSGFFERFEAPASQNELVASSGKGERDSAADAAARARDDGNASGHVR